MKIAPHCDNEEARLKALRALNVLDTATERDYDDIASLAALICETPIALVSLVDQQRQWFKARVGLDACETSRDLAFCAHAILQHDVLIVPDTLLDERFADNPLVTGEPHIRFYAGAPIIDADNLALGTVCVIDRKPRTLDARQQTALVALAHQVSCQFALRRTLIEQHRLAESKKRMMAVLTHDLRNVFNVQMNFADRLALKVSQWDQSRIVDCANTIARATRDANRLLEEVLDWTRFELGGYTFARVDIDIESLLHDVATSCEAQALHKQVALDINVAGRLKAQGDKAMLESALRNLVNNAIKFSRAGDQVTVRAQANGNTIRFSVIDRGIGMDSTQVRRLFSRGDFESTKGTAGEAGTGIGTQLVQHFVDAHGGGIEVESAPGQGTSIHITIPAS